MTRRTREDQKKETNKKKIKNKTKSNKKTLRRWKAMKSFGSFVVVSNRKKILTFRNVSFLGRKTKRIVYLVVIYVLTNGNNQGVHCEPSN